MMASNNGTSESAFVDGSVTKSELKRQTGEFDLESIFHLDLSSRRIRTLGCLPDCTALEFLNLAHNQLTDNGLGMLAGLKRLRYLNLAGNRLSGVSGLDGCEALVELNLAGNLIACTEDLQALTGLDNLESLHLQDSTSASTSGQGGHLTNPICMSAGYAAKILDCLPGLACLDGDRVRGSGEAYFQLCQQIEQALSGNFPSDSTTGRHLAPAGMGEAFWTAKNPRLVAEAASEVAEAETAFADAVSRVRDRELRAMLKIEECERDLRKRKA